MRPELSPGSRWGLTTVSDRLIGCGGDSLSISNLRRVRYLVAITPCDFFSAYGPARKVNVMDGRGLRCLRACVVYYNVVLSFCMFQYVLVKSAISAPAETASDIWQLSTKPSYAFHLSSPSSPPIRRLRLCLHWFVCQQNNSKTCRQTVLIKYFGAVGRTTSNSDYISVVIWDNEEDTRILNGFFYRCGTGEFYEFYPITQKVVD